MRGKDLEEKIRGQLFEMQDLGYKAFHEKLIPTVEPDRVIGVRIPELRKFAKQFSRIPVSAFPLLVWQRTTSVCFPSISSSAQRTIL